jgi:hypothetical protein
VPTHVTMDLKNSSTVDPYFLEKYLLEKSFAFWDTAGVIRFEITRYAKWAVLMILKAWIDYPYWMLGLAVYVLVHLGFASFKYPVVGRVVRWCVCYVSYKVIDFFF